MKRLVLTVILVVCSSLTLAAGEKLRIVHFNAEFLTAPGTRTGQVQRYRFDIARELHCERMAALIETLQPDILNLCEVINGETVNHVVKILHDKGLTDYRGYHLESGDTFTGQDVAVITRLKPDVPDGKPVRSFFSPAGDKTWREKYAFQDAQGNARERQTSVSKNLVYYFTVGGHKLGFLGLHLKSNPEDEAACAQRSAEAKIARKILKQEIVDKGYLPIVIGDLNDYDPDVPDRDETRNTKTTVLADFKNYDQSTPSPELVNPASLIKRQADRYTNVWDRNENGALDSDDVQTMLDYILLPKELMPMVRRAHISHAIDPNLSDHHPVIVDLELK